MMLLGLIPFAVSLVLVPAAPALSRCLAPWLAAPLLTLLGLATALATGVVLCLAAFIAVARLPVAARLGRWSPEPLQAGQPAPGWGVLAGAVASVLLAGAILFAARAGRDLARAVRACRDLDHDGGAAAGAAAGSGAAAGAASHSAAAAGAAAHSAAAASAATGTGRIVITRDDRPLAYAVPLPAGAIVVSTGMLQLLSPAERRALLAHESAHLRQYHALYVLLADLAARANPLLRPLAAQVRLATELAADERAAAEVGDRRVVARALARASLAAARPRPDDTGPGGSEPGGPEPRDLRADDLRTGHPGTGHPGTGHPGTDRAGTSHPGTGRAGPGSAGPAGSLAIADTHAGTRVRALLEPPRRRRPWAAATAVALTLASAATAITLTLTTHQQIELAQLDYARAHPTAPPEAGPSASLAARAP